MWTAGEVGTCVAKPTWLIGMVVPLFYHSTIPFHSSIPPVLINPAGPVHIVFTVSGTSTARLNITMQVRVTADPTTMVPLLMVAVEVGILVLEENRK